MNAARRTDDKSSFRFTPARIGLWLVIAVIGVLAGLQWRARHNHELATKQLAEIQREVDSGARERLPRQQANELFKSASVTVRSQSSIYRWRGPFSSYYIRIVLDENDEVLWYDTQAPIPPRISETASVGDQPTASQPSEQEPSYNIDTLLADAVVPEPDQPLPEAIEKVRLLSSQTPSHPFAPDTDTVVQSQYVNRRVRWYRILLLDSFKKHAQQAPQWAKLAEAFLMQAAVELGNDRPLAGLYAQGCQLIDRGCDDPLILSLVLQDHQMTTHLRTKRPQNVQFDREIFEAFLSSTYPPNAAYLAAYPLLDAIALLRLQDSRFPDGAEPKHDLFAVDKPIEMRFLYQHLVGKRKPPSGGMGPYSDLPRVLATQQTPPPWLKHMLIAAINSDPAVLRSCWLNAWYVLPENPEAPCELFRQSHSDYQGAGYYQSFVGEAENFWFHQAVKAQCDYLPAYQCYIPWLQWDCLNYFHNPEHYSQQFMAHGLQCLRTGRFDTDVPLQFLHAVEHLMTITDPGALFSGFFRSKKYLGAPRVQENVDLLLQGYAEHPQYAPLLENYAVCAAYFRGDYAGALAKLNALSAPPDPVVFNRCKVTPDEVRRAAELAHAHQTFDVGHQTAIRDLTFTSDGSSLICMAGDERAYRFVLESGELDERFEGQAGVYPIFVAADNSNLLAFEKPGIISQRSAETFAKRTELKLPASFAGTLASDSARGYWCTANTEGEDQGLTIHFRSAQDGHVAARLATPFQQIFNIHVAALKPYVAITGFKVPEADKKAAITAGVWNFESGELVFQGAPSNRFVDQIALTRNGDILVVSGGEITSAIGGGVAPFYTVKTVNVDTRIILNWYGHPVRVTCLLVLEDQNLLVTGCEDGVVRFFEFDTGKLLAKCIGHRHGISSLALSPDKKVLASGGNDGRIFLWGINQPLQPAQIQFSLLDYPMTAVVALAEDPSTGDIFTLSRGEGSLRWLASTSYQHPEIMSAGSEFVTAGARLFPVHSATREEVNRQEKILQTLTERAAGTEPPVRQVPSASPERTLFTPDGRSTIKSGNVVTIHNRETNTPWPWGLLRGHPGPVVEMSLSADGRWLLTKSNNPDAHVRVWELPADPTAADAAVKPVLECSPALRWGSWGTSISPDGRTFLLADDVSYVQVWDTASGKMKTKLKGQAATFSPDGKWIAMDGNNFNIVIYDAESLMERKAHQLVGGGPSLLQWGKDSQSLLFCVHGWVAKIDRESGQDILRQR